MQRARSSELAAILLAFASCVALVSAQNTGRPQRASLDDGRPWLESDPDLSSDSTGLLRGAVATAFNDAPQAETILRDVIRSQLGSDAATQAHELLSRIYLRSGQYKRLIENLDQWARSYPDRSEVSIEKIDIEQFRGLPDQINGPRRASILRHAADDLTIPLSINGQPATYLLDTGAWVSVMTESEATRFGLSIRATTGSLGDPSGRGVKVRTAVAKDVKVGAMRFRNVSFAILPNAEPWTSMSPGHRGILGMPILLGLGQVRWSSSGTWNIGGTPESAARTARNIVFSGNHLLLATVVENKRVFGTLDTGAETTDLNANFVAEFSDLVAQRGIPATREIIGVGGAASLEAMTLPELQFQIDTARPVLRPAHVTLQRTAALGGNCCIGNLGRDLLIQTGTFTLDFSRMTLRLQ